MNNDLNLSMCSAPKAWCLVFGIMLSFFTLPAWPEGLPDQGFDNGAPYVRTEYLNTNEGTSANPLTINQCFFPLTVPECQNPPSVYQQSNFWSQNVPAWCSPWALCNNYWTLILNNEDAFKTLNPGPPCASLPRSLPGAGIFGFNTIYDNFPGNNVPGDNMWRAHLVFNLSSQFVNPTTNKIPYMAMGAWSDRGAPDPIGVINPSNASKFTTIEFGERVWDFIEPTGRWISQPPSVMSSLVVFADWGTHPKAIELHLFHSGTPYDYQGQIGARDWNWPIEESTYYPGARFVYMNAEDIDSLCGFSVARMTYIHEEINYSINLNALFHCVDGLSGITGSGGQTGPMFTEPLPQSSDIPITSVSWATEGSGKDGGIWVDVHSMRMVTSSQQQNASPAMHPAEVSDKGYSPITARIQSRMDALCDAEPGCPERARISRYGDPGLFKHVPLVVARKAAYDVYGVTLYSPVRNDRRLP